MLIGEVIGHLGSDAEVRNINGKEYISMSIAINQIEKDSTGEKIEKTTWISVLKRGEGSNILPFLKKGTRLFLRGRLQVGRFEDKNGDVQFSINLYATELELCGK